MKEGWIKLHRKVLDSTIFKNSNTFKVAIWCLLKAAHKETLLQVGQQKIKIQPGQFIFGRQASAKELKIPPSTIRNIINNLAKDSFLDSKPTNKYSIISIKNWNRYQGNGQETGQVKDTNKNDKEYIYTPNSKNEIQNIFSYWNSKGIIKHRELTKVIQSSINARLNKYSVEEIKEAIDNYHKILTDEKYYWTHKWTLKEFLLRGLEKFLTENKPFENYVKSEIKQKEEIDLTEERLRRYGKH